MEVLQDIIPFITQVDHQDQSIVVATVMQIEEPSYCRLGTRILLIQKDQSFRAVCEDWVDPNIIDHIKHLARIDTGRQVYRCTLNCLGNSEQDRFQGDTAILLEPLNNRLTRTQFDFVTECSQEQQAGAMATVFAVEGDIPAQVGSRLFLKMNGDVVNQIGDHFLTNLIFQDTVKILAGGKTRVRNYPFIDGYVQALIEVFLPPLQLLIFGMTPYTYPISCLAKKLGWTVIIIKHPSQSFAEKACPDVDQVLPLDIQDLSKQIQLSPSSAAIVMAGSFDLDLAVLKFLWPSEVKYLGIPGSKARTQQLLKGLEEGGIHLLPEKLHRFYSPIGLDIGAETPHEIALGIVSEIQAVARHRTGSCLREKQSLMNDFVSGLASPSQ